MNTHLLLYLLEDGEWHRLPDLAKELGWTPDQVAEAASRFSQAHTVEFEEETNRVRLNPRIRQFPFRVKAEEGKASLGTLILPPEGTITLQNIVITNLMDIDIEVGVRVIDEKLREVAISKLPSRPSLELERERKLRTPSTH